MENIRFALPGGRPLSALHHGPASERAVVFCHGPGASGAALAPDEDELSSANLSWLIPQRPGIGRSELRTDYSVEEIAEDIDRLLRHLNIRTIYLCAWSAGAAYAVTYAALFPTRVAGLGLMSPALPFAGPLSKFLPARWRNKNWFNLNFPFVTRGLFQQKAGRIVRDAERELERSLKKSPIADRVIFEQLHYRVALMEDLRQAWQNGGAGVLADCRAIGRCAWDLSGISAPVDIWQGSSDTVWTMETAKVLAQSHPAAQLQVVQNQGHLMYLTRLQEFSRRAASLLP